MGRCRKVEPSLPVAGTGPLALMLQLMDKLLTGVDAVNVEARRGRSPVSFVAVRRYEDTGRQAGRAGAWARQWLFGLPALGLLMSEVLSRTKARGGDAPAMAQEMPWSL